MHSAATASEADSAVWYRICCLTLTGGVREHRRREYHNDVVFGAADVSKYIGIGRELGPTSSNVLTVEPLL